MNSTVGLHMSKADSRSNGSVQGFPFATDPQLATTATADSPQGSDEDDSLERRGRQLGNLAELQKALRSSIDVKREPSPNGNANISRTSSAGPGLTPEALKILHTRSSSDVALSSKAPCIELSPCPLSDDSDLEEDELRMKPPLLRKKSGELVKPALRPPSRRRPSSAPGTPTFSKAVHFNDDIEQVRHFLQVDRPIAVSAGSSPVETYDSESEYPFRADQQTAARSLEWEIRLANFPRDSFERQSQPIRLDRLFLSSDHRNLIGSVSVANIAFHKFVVARFTFDYWKTTSEVVAEFNHDVRKQQVGDGYDRFTFSIKLSDQANLETKTLLLCVRYNVNGQEYWDNNNWMNFQVDFVKKAKTANVAVGKQGTATQSKGVIPRSRQSASAPRPRSMPLCFDDEEFLCLFDPKHGFNLGKIPVDESQNPMLRFRDPSNAQRSSLPNPVPRKTSGQAFSTRYDFGASLSATISSPQSPVPSTSPKPAQNLRLEQVSKPTAISSEKPDVKSAEYNELIQKYCFFGSGKNPSSTHDTKHAAQTDGINHEEVTSEQSSSSGTSSGSNSPVPIKDLPPQVDGAADVVRSHLPYLSRSTSPAAITGSRTQSPVSFGYPYRRGGLFGESQTRQAIRG